MIATNRVRCAILILFLPTLALAQPAAKTGNGSPFDLQRFIDQQLRAGERHIVIPPGRYRVTPHDHQHLVLHDMKDVEIIADGVEMICTETTRALTIRHCTNLTLRGLVIDYDPLPFTQGRITSISADRTIHEIELFDGYPPAEEARKFKYEIFRPNTRTLRGDDHDPVRLEAIDPRHLRVTIPRESSGQPTQVGDLIVIGSEHAPHGSAAHAILCENDVNLRLENVVLYASNCFGFFETECDGSVYAGCRIDRRPMADDPMLRADARLRSLDADAFHSKHALSGPSYLGCVARFMGDDCINICGDYHMIMASHGNTLRVLAKVKMNIEPGDPVELDCYDGRRLPDAKVTAVQPAGDIQEDEREFLLKQRMNESLRTADGLLIHAYTITLDRPVEIPRGGILCSTNRLGDGFMVKDCTFGFNRSRGILIKASDGQIIGNHLEGCRMSAILIAPEFWWLEAGSASRLKITRNTISNCGGTAISVEATSGDGDPAPAGAHSDLSITENRISQSPLPAIRVSSTDGLQIVGNTFESIKPAKSAGSADAVQVDRCSHTQIENNTSR